MDRPLHVHFLTGRLAEGALRATLAQLADRYRFKATVGVMPISVAALMTPQWLTSRVKIPTATTLVMLPGYCDGDVTALQSKLGVKVVRGPRDLRALPNYFRSSPTLIALRRHSERDNSDSRRFEARRAEGSISDKSAPENSVSEYGDYAVDIIAEINHVPKRSVGEVVQMAAKLRADGADMIDLGCNPGSRCTRIADYVRALCEDGFRVSIDSFDPAEVADAIRAGAELVLSVNASNRQFAAEWGCEVVAIPDDIPTLGGLQETVDSLSSRGIPFRIDPILEPIGYGFAESLRRYFDVRRQYPTASMMMGVGNLTELTDCDSAGINLMLLAICEELKIQSVLTTQVISWAATSVRECDLARRLVHHAVSQNQLPKHVDSRLLLMRDSEYLRVESSEMADLSNSIKDKNFRIQLSADQMHLVSAGLHLADTDPFRLFERLLQRRAESIESSHAFYLGFELAKARIAMTLGKNYHQDDPLDWGFLTQQEGFHRIRSKRTDDVDR